MDTDKENLPAVDAMVKATKKRTIKTKIAFIVATRIKYKGYMR